MSAPDLSRFSGQSRFVDANGIRLHFLEYGSGEKPTIVIVPGITSPAVTWEFVAEPLSRDHHVLTMDVRGRGLSDHPESGFTLPDYARDVAESLDALDLKRTILLGHSMGARIVAAFGALYPGRAVGYIVADPPMTGPGRPPYPTSEEDFIRSIRQAKAGATADDMRPYFPTWTDEQLALRAEWLPTCDVHAVAESHRNFHREDLFEYWRALPPPALFLYGSESPAVSAEAAAEVAAANPAAEVACVPGAGHMLPWDNLDGFLEPVRRFVAAVAEREER